MDYVLHYFDEYAGDEIYRDISRATTYTVDYAKSLIKSPSAQEKAADWAKSIWTHSQDAATKYYIPRDNIFRQFMSLYSVTYVGIILMYFSVAAFSYYFIFDRRMEQHPLFLKDQVKMEINTSLQAFPWLDLYTVPWFVLDVRGYSMLYDSFAEGPFSSDYWPHWMRYAYGMASIAIFLLFTDATIYWIHRILHHPLIYKHTHKLHHKWIVPTPFASHAFKAVDGYAQSLPYHLACFVFPIHKMIFIGLFSFVNLWSIFIHDSDMLCGHKFLHYINGPAHHTLHHLYFNYNYGQFFCFSDKAGGSFKLPASEFDPLNEILARKEAAVKNAEKNQSTSTLLAPGIVVEGGHDSAENSDSDESLR